MLDELSMAFQVMRRPNSAFAALRDDDRRYFQPSVVMMLLASAVNVGLGSAESSITGQQTMNAGIIFGLTAMGAVTTACTTYLIGRALGGNKIWRKVFTVLFYTGVVWIPVFAVSYLISLLSSDLQDVAFVMLVPILVWAIVITIKAIRVLNGFGTARAFGVMVLSWIIQLFWIIPIGLLYLRTFPLELPIAPMPLQ